MELQIIVDGISERTIIRTLPYSICEYFFSYPSLQKVLFWQQNKAQFATEMQSFLFRLSGNAANSFYFLISIFVYWAAKANKNIHQFNSMYFVVDYESGPQYHKVSLVLGPVVIRIRWLLYNRIQLQPNNTLYRHIWTLEYKLFFKSRKSSKYSYIIINFFCWNSFCQFRYTWCFGSKEFEQVDFICFSLAPVFFCAKIKSKMIMMELRIMTLHDTCARFQ